MLALAQRPASSWLDLAASVVSLAGATSVTLGVALGLVAARLRGRRPEALVPLAIIVVGAIELACKALVPQPLPPHELSRSIELIPTVHAPTAFAFPSGHVARLTFLLSITPVPRWLVVVAVLLMAVTRLYLAEHWLSDVVGGALLGLAVARAARSLGSMRR